MNKEELEKIRKLMVQRDDNAVIDFNLHPSTIEGKLSFIDGRAQDALMVLNVVLMHLIDPSKTIDEIRVALKVNDEARR